MLSLGSIVETERQSIKRRIITASLSSLSFGVSQDFHVAVEARRAARQVFAYCRIPDLDGMFRHAAQVGLRRTANSLRIGEGFGQIRPGEAEKLGIVEIVKRRLPFS